MSLSDLFPEEFKANFASLNVKIGSVIKVFVLDTKPPKEKRLILVGASADKLFFASILVNSEINPNVFNTKDLINLNYKMNAIGREFLDKDSFADCSSLKQRDAKWLNSLVMAEPDRVPGILSVEDLSEIRNRIKSARTISIATKRNYGLFP